MEEIGRIVADLIVGTILDGIYGWIRRNGAFKNTVAAMIVVTAFAAILWANGTVSAWWFAYLPGAVLAAYLLYLIVSALRVRGRRPAGG